ncbi:DUF2637 domain-containing protein [Streptomyces sp. DW26H14]|uniref:DUF2637 domain-containing protein n=1 Tax=Streptomyces sp. DW26H14 TaxID=3435395 RepID=UPI00403DEE25
MAAMQLSRTHRILVGVVITGAVIIAGIGFAGSYAAVRALAESKGFGEFALVFPIGIDAGICVLLALDLLLTWIRIPFPLLRQAAWVLTAATIAFNGAAAWPDPLGVGMHAVIPLLFIVTVEAARHAVGRIADITADKHMEGVRLTRWLLSPVPTFLLWRRMKLWELRSYEQVIKLEQDRLIYQSRLQARFGRGWRRKAPVESLMPLRLAKYGVPLADTASDGLAAAGIETTPAFAPATARELTAGGTATGAAAGAGTAATGAAGEVDLTKRAPGSPQQPWPEAEFQPQARGQEPGGPRPASRQQAAHPGQQTRPRAQLPGQDGQHGQAGQAGQGTRAQAPAPQRQDGQPPYGAPQAPWAHQAAFEEQAMTEHQLRQRQEWAGQEEWAGQQDHPQQDVSPWFAAQSIPQGAYEEAYNPTYVEGLEPTPVLPPAGPGGRGRPLGGGPGVPVPEAGYGPGDGQQQAPEPEPAQDGGDAAEHAAPLDERGPADGLPREEQYYNGLKKYISEYNDMPNERQFGRYLLEMYDLRGRTGGPLSESTLRVPLREAQRRFQEELDSEHIA